jgi:Tfp pilus assembly protein PilX
MYLINKKIVNVNKQSGVSLFISLIILLALTIIGLSAANRSHLQERMAANLHIQNMAYNAAESAINGFIAGGGTGSLASACYDSSGGQNACGSVFLDGDRGSAIRSEVEVIVESVCRASACSGSSVGSDSTMGCTEYKVVGKGTVAGKTVTTSLWAWEQTPCIH